MGYKVCHRIKDKPEVIGTSKKVVLSLHPSV